ncbi:MAG: hypothetical protein K9I92_06220 [Chitinophagaceae bacterium]|nr:hypothetical protein [Chitinophagaceae bacterium]
MREVEEVEVIEEVEVVEEVLACLEELINYTRLPAWTGGEAGWSAATD